jgi:hypothetical protein
MAIVHGRERYRRGCRCDECKGAQAAYQRVYRERQRNGLTVRRDLTGSTNVEPGPVELAVQEEISGLVLAALRPGLVAGALAMARVLDAAAVNAKPQAAKVLVGVLDTLHKGSAQGRRGSLSLVKSMTTSSPPA